MNRSEQKSVVLEDEFLLNCQVGTPLDVVENLWNFLSKRFGKFDKVLDLGAGDGIFSMFGDYNTYHGFEIDKRRMPRTDIPSDANIFYKCAFSRYGKDYDLCIGNPPYIKHNKVQNFWQKSILKNIEDEANIKIHKSANTFLLFLMQALLKTKKDGLVVQIVPYEWASRPTYKSVKDYIIKNKWNVSIYKFSENIFKKVFTTASITVIDKSKSDSRWEFFNIDRAFNIGPIQNITGTSDKLLKHTRRGENTFAQRGLSPGNQKVFCLTEEERLKHSLEINQDVVPCITTLKPLPYRLKQLTKVVFENYYINNNQRCWIVNPTNECSISLLRYFKSIPESMRSNYTCRNQYPWWNYKKHRNPDIVFNPGFKKNKPRFLINSLGVIVVGSAFGIHNVKNISKRMLVNELRKIEFSSKLLEYSKGFQRIEVNQMNTVINQIIHGKDL